VARSVRWFRISAAVVVIVALSLWLSPRWSGSRAEAPAVSRSVTVAPHTPRYRFMFSSESAPVAVASAGWNLLDVGSKWDADRLPPRTRGLVWLGDYDNSSCAWEISDVELSSKLPPMAGDSKVAGYFFSDEPDPYACPKAPEEHRGRSSLIHKLSPGKFTVMVSDSNRGRASIEQIPRWRSAADYVGLNPYPCYRSKPCDYAWIRTIIAAADRAGLRYWGAVQAFADSEWRWPTPSEEKRMLSEWAQSRQQGYMTFAWTWAGHSLRSRPRLLAVLRRFNGGSVKRRTQSRTAQPRTVDEVHYTFTSPTSVAFDWRGTPRTLR